MTNATDSRRPPRRPRRAPLQPRGATDPRHDGDDGARLPARRRRTARQGHRRHRPRRLRRRRLPRAPRRVSRCAAGYHGHATGRDRQPPCPAAAVAEEPAAAHRPAGAPPGDPRHRATPADRHRGPAAHRHHTSAQPAGRGADVPHHAVLGEQRAVPAARGGRRRAGSAQGADGCRRAGDRTW